MAARYQVGVHTIERWHAAGIIDGKRRGLRNYYHLEDSERRIWNHGKQKAVMKKIAPLPTEVKYVDKKNLAARYDVSPHTIAKWMDCGILDNAYFHIGYIIRAEPLGGDAGHGRPDTELSGLITGRTDHATLGGWRTDNHRLADHGRVVALLHGGVERIHVEMGDDAEHRDERLASAGDGWKLYAACMTPQTRFFELISLRAHLKSDLNYSPCLWKTPYVLRGLADE